MNKTLQELADILIKDYESFRNDRHNKDILPQIVFMHLYRAYSIGAGNDGSQLREEWYETVDKDVDYINEHSKVIDVDWDVK